MSEKGATGPPAHRWELTPWSLETVQMLGRACLSTSWTSKAWKPVARKHKAGTELPTWRFTFLSGEVEVERCMETKERQLLGVPKPRSPHDRDGTAFMSILEVYPRATRRWTTLVTLGVGVRAFDIHHLRTMYVEQCKVILK